MKKIVLLTTIHGTTAAGKAHGCSEQDFQTRAAEFEECLARNCKTDVDRIIVFFEGNETSDYPSLAHEKVEVVPISKRPGYKMFFDYANEHLAGNFVAILNGDIYFDQETPVERIKEIKPGHLWAVSRYRLIKGAWRLEPYAGISSDGWIFYAPLKSFDSDFLLGVSGSESYMVQRAIEASIPVLNPCLSLTLKEGRHPTCSPSELSSGGEYGRIHSYHRSPDFRGYLQHYPQPARIEDGTYTDCRSLNLRMRSALFRMVGKNRKRLEFIIRLLHPVCRSFRKSWSLIYRLPRFTRGT